MATVTDQFGNPISGVTVTFAAPGSGASATFPTGATVVTDVNGQATESIGANTIAGTFGVSASVTGVSTPASYVSLTNNADVPAFVNATSGDNQTTTVNTNFASPLSVTVTDQFGNPVSNVLVMFAAPTSGAGVVFPSGSTVFTDANGNASDPISANTVAGTYGVTASVSGLATPASFVSLMNTPDVPASVTVSSGDSQTATVNQAYAAPLVVVVQDQFGNPVSGVSVTFAAPSSGPSATFPGGDTVITDANGLATENFAANTVAGTYSITASASGVSSPASFVSLTNTADMPFAIAATSGDNQSATVNTGFGAPLVATVTDQFGNLVSGASVSFVGPLSGAGATFPSGDTVLTDANGNATEPVSANTVAGNYPVTASTFGVSTPATFASLTNTADVAATITATSGDNQSTLTNSAFSQPLVVTVTDQFGNPVSGVPVNFNFPVSGASASDSIGGSATTDANGQVSDIITANSVGGPFSLTVQAGGVATPASFNSLTNNDPPMITSANSTVFTVGSAGTFSLTDTGFPTPTVSESGALPTGVTFDPSTGTLSGTPAVGTGGDYGITFTATNGFGTDASQPFTLEVDEAPTITSSTTSQFTEGATTTFTITTASHFPAATTITETGTLPTGLSFVDNGDGTATIAGTPSVGSANSYPITITASNGISPDATQALVLVVSPQLVLTAPPLAQDTVGVAYNQTIGVTGGSGDSSLAYTVTGTIPDGLTISPASPATNSFAITGTPTVAGTFTIDVTATDSIGATAAQSYSVVVNAPVSLTAGPLPDTSVGAPYNQSITTTGGTGDSTLTYTITGTVPDGVTINPPSPATNSITVSGTPTDVGTFTISVSATDSLNSAPALQTYTVTVNPGVTLTPSTLPDDTVGVPYNQTISATGGTGDKSLAYTITGTIPDGLTILPSSPATNSLTISGTPTVAGSFTINISATDSTNAAPVVQSFTIVVNGPVTLTPATLPNPTVGLQYNQTISTTGGTGDATLTYTVTGTVPDGLTISPASPATGGITITGTPTDGGTFTIAVSATDSLNAPATQQSYTLVVNPNAPLTITPTSLPDGKAGAAYSQNIQIGGGKAPYQSLTVDGFSSGGTGLAQPTVNLAGGTVTVSGTPTAGGTLTFTVDVMDGNGQTLSQNYTLTIDQAPTITSAASASFFEGVAGSFSVTTGHAFPTATTLAEAGTLPSGLTFVDNGNGTATLAGTPVAGSSAVYHITITASNGITPDAVQAFTLTVGTGTTTIAITEATPGNSNGFRDIALAATVSSSSGTVTDGTVTFTILASNNGLIGTLPAAVVNGVATATFYVNQSLPAGTYKILAVYSGSAAFTSSMTTASVTLKAPTPDVFAVGAGAGGSPLVQVYSSVTGIYLYTIDAFGNFQGGVRVATGLLNGQDVIIAAAGPGGLPFVNVYLGDTGKMISQFLAFDAAFAGGVYVAAGDLNGNGGLEIVSGAGAISYGQPIISVKTIYGGFLAPYTLAFDASFHGGVRVAVADLAGNGKPDIVATAGPGGFPFAQIIDGRTFALGVRFSAFASGYSGGVFVSSGYFDNSGVERLVFSTGTSPTPTIAIEDGLGKFFAESSSVAPGFTGAIPVSTILGGALGQTEDVILMSSGAGGDDLIKAFDSFLNPLSTTFPTFPGFGGGSFVG